VPLPIDQHSHRAAPFCYDVTYLWGPGAAGGYGHQVVPTVLRKYASVA
jgi:hypothetical protein